MTNIKVDRSQTTTSPNKLNTSPITKKKNLFKQHQFDLLTKIVSTKPLQNTATTSQYQPLFHKDRVGSTASLRIRFTHTYILRIFSITRPWTNSVTKFFPRRCCFVVHSTGCNIFTCLTHVNCKLLI